MEPNQTNEQAESIRQMLREQAMMEERIRQRREEERSAFMQYRPVNAFAASDNIWSETIEIEEREVTSNKKKRMKERHLNQDERAAKHNPATDWREYKRGEKCFNASSLDVSDIVTKHGALVT